MERQDRLFTPLSSAATYYEVAVEDGGDFCCLDF